LYAFYCTGFDQNAGQHEAEAGSGFVGFGKTVGVASELAIPNWMAPLKATKKM